MLDHPDQNHLVLGRLGWNAIPLHEPILLATFAAVALGGAAVLGLVMLLRGFADAIMMRAQQAVAFGDNMGFLPPHHYDQIFTAHGVIMIFFVAMPLVTGLMNYVVPLQIG